MPNTAKLVVIPSVWGHMGKSFRRLYFPHVIFLMLCELVAGNGRNPPDLKFMQEEIMKFLEETNN
jgi:hypothetical protein